MSHVSESRSITRFFVYGTLCRGQCREKCWPREPLEITPAWTFGTLFGRADYPAMRPGNDRVIGECWRFDADAIAHVRMVLDEIEVTDQPGMPNLYDAVAVEVFTLASIDQRVAASSDRIGLAQAYHYSNPPERDGFLRMASLGGQGIRWPDPPA